MAAKTGARYEDLVTAFRHRRFKPLYFFYGDEGFLIDELQQQLIEQALEPHEHPFNLDIVFGPEADTQAVLAQCAAYPMMAERRVVVVRGFEKLDNNRPFASYAEQPNPSAIVLLLCNGKPNLAQHPYRALKQHAVWAEFKSLYDRQLPGWITAHVKAKGFTLEGGAAARLAEGVGADLRTLAHEVDKLLAYVGDRREITEDDVVQAGGHSREHNVFELQKALGLGEHERALTIATHMMGHAASRRSDAIGMVAVLTGYVTKLWKLTACLADNMPEGQMVRHIGVPPYYLKEYLAALRYFRLPDLRRAFEALVAADVELKGGSSRDPQLIITLLLSRIRPSRVLT